MSDETLTPPPFMARVAKGSASPSAAAPTEKAQRKAIAAEGRGRDVFEQTPYGRKRIRPRSAWLVRLIPFLAYLAVAVYRRIRRKG